MRIRTFTALLGALVIAAVTTESGTAQPDSTDRDANRDIKVTVINNNWADIRVYVVSSSYTVRLGTVSGLGQAAFTMPRALPRHGDFQLAIRPIGQRIVHYSQPILASAGDNVEFRVQNHLALSSAIVH